MNQGIKRITQQSIDRLNRLLMPVFGDINPTDVAICTIHGNSPAYSGEFAAEYAWPELQIQQLRKHTAGGFHVYAYGNRIIPEHETFLKKCDEVTFISSESTPNGEFDHVWPLRNWLTRQAIKTHKIIVHLDSDAYPVNDNWINRYNQKLSLCSPVVAVKRLENGDSHSDRCFLMFNRNGFKKHSFDFSTVNVKDAGGGISLELESQQYAWQALLRSNHYNYHPVIAGIYDDHIYHHAAGSREPRLRANQNKQNIESLWQFEKNIHRLLMKRLFEHTDHFLDELRGQKACHDISNGLNLADMNGENTL